MSFIIPTFNEAKGIVTTLAQFKDLRRIDHEVIVSDNGSTDNTIALARQVGAQVVVRPSDTKTTIGECRNRGARAASGDILCSLMPMCTWSTVSSCQGAGYFSDHQSTVASTMRITIYPEENKWIDSVIYAYFNALVYLQNRVFKTGASPGDCMMIRRRDFERVYGFKPKLPTAEDFELFSRLAKVGEIGYFWHRKVAMSPRRLRRDGWPNVLWLWWRNWWNQVVLGKVSHTDWEARR